MDVGRGDIRPSGLTRRGLIGLSPPRGLRHRPGNGEREAQRPPTRRTGRTRHHRRAQCRNNRHALPGRKRPTRRKSTPPPPRLSTQAAPMQAAARPPHPHPSQLRARNRREHDVGPRSSIRRPGKRQHIQTSQASRPSTQPPAPRHGTRTRSQHGETPNNSHHGQKPAQPPNNPPPAAQICPRHSAEMVCELPAAWPKRAVVWGRL